MITTTQFPQPAEHETYESFVMRAHQELFESMPEPMERNRAVWSAWESARGDEERYRARSIYATDKFDRKDDVCYWHEHSAVSYDADGNPVERNNDVNRIIEIISENNHRIADTDSYPAIVDKHNKPPIRDPQTGVVKKQDDPMPPKAIGFAGPFRLGMIGRKNPRYAAFADEFQRRDRKDVFEDRPRRSVEVLTLKANGRSYFDPIAALGGESPRLPLPPVTQYSPEIGEYERTIYEAVPALPGGNTYLPGGGESRNKRTHYGTSSGEESNDPNQVDAMNDGPDQTRLTIDALMATPLMKFLQQFAEANGFSAGGQQAQPQFGGPQPGQQTGQDQFTSQQPMRYSAEDVVELPGEELDGYELIDADANTVTVEQFSAMQNSIREVMGENARLRQNQVKLAAKSADAERKQALTTLHSKFPHFIDLDAELGRCLYEAGSEFTEREFDSHIDMLETYAAKAPPVGGGRMVPGGESAVDQPAAEVETAQYEAQISSRATEIYTEQMDAGNVLTPTQAYEMASKEVSEAGKVDQAVQ